VKLLESYFGFEINTARKY